MFYLEICTQYMLPCYICFNNSLILAHSVDEAARNSGRTMGFASCEKKIFFGSQTNSVKLF